MGILKRKSYLIILSVMLVLLIIFAYGVTLAAFDSEKIHGGVKVSGISLSGLTRDEAAKKLSKELKDPDFNKDIKIKFGDKEKTVKVSDFIEGLSPDKSADAAYAVGRDGGIFKNTFTILGAKIGFKNLKPELKYQQENLDAVLEDIMSDVGEKVEEYSYEIADDGVFIYTGKAGFMPDKKMVEEKLTEQIKKGNFKKTIVFKKEERQPSEIDVDLLYKELCTPPADAGFIYQDGEVKVTPHKMGVEFDIKEAERIINENKGAGKKFKIPAVVTKPALLTEDIEGRIFTETLASYSSTYNQGVVGRSKNVRLSAELINGTILMPGDEFSYNGIVGERTADRGFAIASVYLDGESVDGIGGGICQVSSTLYCAVLYADLEVTERVNHQLTVGYVPLGQDATVDYGNIDFKFKNNTNYPVKIVADGSGGVVSIKLLGYKEDKTKKVIIENVVTGHIEPAEKIEKDPTMPLGERKVVSEGASGAVVVTYKTVMSDGKEVSKKQITTSRYGAGKTLVKEGTGEEVLPEDTGEGESPEETPAETPSEVPAGIPAETPAEAE